MYDYFEVLGEVQLLPAGAMHWIVGCWINKASRDAGDPAAVTTDFVSDVYRLIGKPRRVASTRIRGQREEYELVDGTWMDRATWYRDYPVLDASGNVITPRPERVLIDLSPVDAAWALQDMILQMRAWLRKIGDGTGDRTNSALVNGPRAVNTLPANIRLLDNAGFEDSSLVAFTGRLA